LVDRYDELLATALSDSARLRKELAAQGRVVLALDRLQPDVGYEVLWVLRDCISSQVLLARSLLSSTSGNLVQLLHEALEPLGKKIEVVGVISDGQHSIRLAVAQALPEVPHQLCQFHFLREAALPVFEEDRHLEELKAQVRGVRPIERSVEDRDDVEAQVVRRYCSAVRSAITDDDNPPLDAAGVRLKQRLDSVTESLQRVAQKGGRTARRR
jgi:hypothetical protein